MSRAVESAAAAAKTSQGSEDSPESICDIDINGENLFVYLSVAHPGSIYWCNNPNPYW